MKHLESDPRWVTQTQLYNAEDGERAKGNCTEAAFASILNIPLEDVPDFRENGEDAFWEMVERYANEQGYQLHIQPRFHPDGFYLGSGLSPRGVNHMVVMLDGEIFWDPHPSRAGCKIDCTYTLIPLDPGRFKLKS